MTNIESKTGVLFNPTEDIFEKAKQEGRYSELSVEESREINKRIAKGLEEDKYKNWNERHRHIKPTYFTF